MKSTYAFFENDELTQLGTLMKRVGVLLIFLLPQGFILLLGQTQIGLDIDGEASGDFSGIFVALSDDGGRIAVGASRNDGNGDNSGHVRVYDLIGGAWTQVGSDIDGEAAGDQLGYSVSLSGDGSRLVAGGRLNGGTDPEAGHARVYELVGGVWTQIGSDLDGEAGGDQAGLAVALSSGGDRVAVGAFRNAGNGSAAGHVRVYELNLGSWTQLGSDLDGEAPGDESGVAVSISATGNRVAIGAPNNDGNGMGGGHARVFEWNGMSWNQMGADIDGAAAGDEFGRSVALSANGLRLAVGAPGNSGNGMGAGHVRIFDFTGGAWVQTGGDLEGENAGDRSGISVSLSSDGNRVVIGAINNGGAGAQAGHARIYEWNGSQWNQLGMDIDGETAGDISGQNVAFSGDGNRVGIGAPGNDQNGAAAGQARVFGLVGLPVGLTSFTKSIEDGEVQLYWTTSSEKDNRGFEVEHSVDGQSWRMLGFRRGSGTTTIPREYVYVHPSPKIGHNYYRLRQIDFDGRSAPSEALVVYFDAKPHSVQIGPNPVSNFLKVWNGRGMGRIYDSRGQLMLQQLLSFPNTEIDVASLPPGQYTLVVGEALQPRSWRRFVKGE